MHDIPRCFSGAARILAAALIAVLPLLAAHPASADAPPDTPTPAAHLAGLLEDEPEGEAVVVSDLLAGAYDTEELGERVSAEFARLDTPFHVVVTPPMSTAVEGDDLVAALRDRIGEDGVYVHVSEGRTSVATAATPGVRLPVDDAEYLLLIDEDLDYDSSPALIAERYVDALLDPEAERKADEAREAHLEAAEQDGDDRSPSGEEDSAFADFLDDLRPDDPTGLGNLGFLAATVSGAVLGAGGLAVYWRLRKGRPVLSALVYGVAAVSVLAAAGLYAAWDPLAPSEEAGADEQEEAPEQVPPEEALAEPPYVAETVRVDRVAAEMEDGGIPVDPLWSGERGDLAGLRERAAEAPVPVYMASVISADSDESGGDTEVLAHALAHTVGEDGLYVVMDPRGLGTGIATRGVELPITASSTLREGVSEAAEEGAPGELPVAEHLEPVLDLAQEAEPDPGAEDSMPMAAESLLRDDGAPEEARAADFFSEGFFAGLLVLGPILGALVYVTLLLLKGGAQRWAGSLAATPGRRLGRVARRDVERAMRALETAAPDAPGVAEATREADIAVRVLRDERADELDQAAAAVLARRAADRLDPDTPDTAERPVCMVNPLHGPSEGRGRTSLAGRSDPEQGGKQSRRQGGTSAPKAGSGGGTLPMCRACLDREDTRRIPLRVRAGAGGRRVPHLGLDRMWVRSEYRSRLIPDDPFEEEARAR
ncbi:hypothetical protein [Nocardiopsis baichengensis]|uniref:hypothetical protein n=1 Tax=Nocardiopsis baichengensis TaxID=280240 RepID=UPI00034C342F|nr:hypothetical protein [Nocardiopsis baichengensis]